MADADSHSTQENTQTTAPAAESIAIPTNPASSSSQAEGRSEITPEADVTPAEPKITLNEPVDMPQSELQTAQAPANEPLPIEPKPSAPESPSAPIQAIPMAPSRDDLLMEANKARQDRKHKKLEKILEALNTKDKISNDEIEKFLRVSDATATRYLSILEKEGKIKQVGKTGKGVVYIKV